MLCKMGIDDPQQDNVISAADLICRRTTLVPRIAIILGTGLGGFAESVNIEAVLPYAEVPGFHQPTASSHRGRVIIGRVQETPVILLQGRLHLYEGYNLDEIAFPTRLLAKLGIDTLITSCAAGGLHPEFRVGDLMIIRDHIDFLRPSTSILNSRYKSCSPLEKKDQVKVASQVDWSPCQPALRGRMSCQSTSTGRQSGPSPEVYSLPLITRLESLAREQGTRLQQGVYVSVPGPNYETRAEIRFYGGMADAIGMSVVPEVICARQLKMEVVALAAITNMCQPGADSIANSAHVTAAAEHVEPRFRQLVLGLIHQQIVD